MALPDRVGTFNDATLQLQVAVTGGRSLIGIHIGLRVGAPQRTSPSGYPEVGHWISNGMLTCNEVPLPVWVEIFIVPPSASTRSIRPVSPVPLAGSAPPTPSSRTERCR